MAIVTTRDINLKRDSNPTPLKQKTTKDVKVEYIDKDGPFQPGAGPMVTTRNVRGMRERQEREAVMKEREELEKKKEARERMAKARAAKKKK